MRGGCEGGAGFLVTCGYGEGKYGAEYDLSTAILPTRRLAGVFLHDAVRKRRTGQSARAIGSGCTVCGRRHSARRAAYSPRAEIEAALGRCPLILRCFAAGL